MIFKSFSGNYSPISILPAFLRILKPLWWWLPYIDLGKFDCLETVTQGKHYNIFIAGDYINLLKESGKKKRLMNTMKSYGLVPIFNEASRASKRTSSCIDNVFTNITNNCLNIIISNEEVKGKQRKPSNLPTESLGLKKAVEVTQAIYNVRKDENSKEVLRVLKKHLRNRYTEAKKYENTQHTAEAENKTKTIWKIKKMKQGRSKLIWKVAAI
ncbi:hypothetical protein HHI36_015924 [Cryptolaemus montrouzieri]|uniref:Uncharacterized protein n=1 Tax=Cryptolaemus montrouzieri TaxID=559131 RepID=A0ABD2N7U6_9CUCU